MTTILVGTDTTASADLAVEGAARLARAQDAELILLLVKPVGDVRAVSIRDAPPIPTGISRRCKRDTRS